MLKRSVLLGGLIAGAFLLPTVADAGVVSGVCSNCHTMHNSQNGTTPVGGQATPQNTLLLGTGCVGCHADPAINNAANGRGATGVKAPQVDKDTAFINNAGYFDNTAPDNTHHNVVGIDALADGNITGGVSPGGTFPTVVGSAPSLTCASCHSSSGGHHGTTSSTYRLLGGTNTTSEPAKIYGAQAASNGIGHRSATIYDATAMNKFCARCHGTFHQGDSPTSASGNQRSGTLGTWIRHPTDISLSNQKAAGASIAPSLQDSNPVLSDAVIVGTATSGTDSGKTDVVMCISCHLPHGGPNADLLSFAYSGTNNSAGDGTRSTGCESCHSYNDLTATPAGM